MDDIQNNPVIGRPPTTESENDLVFRKLEGYLKAGQSIYKACVSAGIAKTRIYDLYNDNSEFAEKIDACRHYREVLASSILLKELERINTHVGTTPLSSDEIKFLQWISERRTPDFDSLPQRTNLDKVQYMINRPH